VEIPSDARANKQVVRKPAEARALTKLLRAG
jgi:hypothetical protein